MVNLSLWLRHMLVRSGEGGELVVCFVTKSRSTCSMGVLNVKGFVTTRMASSRTTQKFWGLPHLIINHLKNKITVKEKIPDESLKLTPHPSCQLHDSIAAAGNSV